MLAPLAGPGIADMLAADGCRPGDREIIEQGEQNRRLLAVVEPVLGRVLEHAAPVRADQFLVGEFRNAGPLIIPGQHVADIVPGGVFQLEQQPGFVVRQAVDMLLVRPAA